MIRSKENKVSVLRRIGNVLNRETVAINIEDSELRFMAVKNNRVTRWGSVPLEQGIVKDGLVLNQQALISVIKELFSSQHLNSRKVAISVSGFQSVQRIIELPRMSKKLLSQAILNEAKLTLPISPEKLYLSWQKIFEARNILHFFLIGIPRPLLDAQVKCLQQSGIKPCSVDLKTMALAGLVSQKEALILNLELENCEIILIANGVPLIIRNIPVRSLESLSDRARVVLQELERTLKFFESTYPEISLSKSCPLYLAGKLANEPEMTDIITSQAGLTVCQLKTSLKHPAGFPVALYAINIGLSSKPSGASGFLVTNLDFLSRVSPPKNLTAKQALSVCGLLAAVAIIFPLYNMGDSASAEVSRLQNENIQLQQGCIHQQDLIKQAGQLQTAIEDTRAARQKLADIIQDFERIKDQRQRAYNYLHLASDSTPNGLLPQGADLVSVSQQNGRISLTGTASSFDVALSYADALRKSPGFTNVQVLSLTLVAGDQNLVSFDISSDWN